MTVGNNEMDFGPANLAGGCAGTAAADAVVLTCLGGACHHVSQRNMRMSAPLSPPTHQLNEPFHPHTLAGFASTLEAPLLSCNVDASRNAHLAGKVKPYTIKTLPVSGKKVAIIGLTPPDTAATSSPGGQGEK